ncbi:MAG TPA: spore germination protein [Ruminococcaceae bacterium]|nr:spore germination protein [Oscillospiraceae bacterium]
MFSNSADLSIKDIILKSNNNLRGAVITVEGLCSKDELAQSVLNPLMMYDFKDQNADEAINTVFERVSGNCDLTKFNSVNELIAFITSGFAVIVLDGCKTMLAAGVQGYSFRSVSEPESEVVQRGAREGFTEPLRVNMSLIRRRVKNPDLVFEQLTVGTESKTQIMICYLKHCASPLLIKKVKKRLNECQLPTVFAAGYLSEYLEDKSTSRLFSGAGISERPDTVCGKLTEGRIAVLVDGTPAVIIIPRLFVEEFQGVDDYSNRSYYATLIRIIKYLSFFFAVFAPALYVALAQFHPEYIPTWILIKTSESLALTPLPVTLEVLLITFVYEIMKEAGLRIPKSLGHAVSIVGGLVVGESAVNAGIISASTLMVVATAAICSYVTSPLYPPVTILRVIFIITAGVAGLWGIVLVTAVVIISMCSKTSLGVPYMSALSPFSLKAMRDVFIRASWKKLGARTMQVQKFPETEEK